MTPLTPDLHWDKAVAIELRKLGLNQEQVGVVIGIIAEHRQISDLQGYKRGYNDGYERGYKKGCGNIDKNF